MTARFSVKNSHIEDELILVLKKLTPTVKVITVRLRIAVVGFSYGLKTFTTVFFLLGLVLLTDRNTLFPTDILWTD